MPDEDKRKEQLAHKIIKVCQQGKVTMKESNSGCQGERVSSSQDPDPMDQENEVMKTRNLESLGILAGGIAHDFNNILTIISGNISLIRMLVTPEGEIAGRLTEMEKAFLRAKTLTRQLLTFSTGGAPVKRIICISELMRDSALLSLKGTDTRCSFHIPNEPFPVEVDTEQMQQAINNLMINAVQALPEGGNIKVAIENVILGSGNTLPLSKGKYVKITIQDDGIGISPENMQKVFDPYFTTKEINSGLGLSIAYSIIKRQGGYITVTSKKEVGTTFSLYLPAMQQGISFESGVKEKRVRGKTASVIVKKILVMDDKETIRNIVKEMLMYISCEVDVASNGEEAIKLYTKEKESGNPFDAVIMDLMIAEGMGGQETIKRLRKIDPDVKAVVSSGYSSDPVMANYEKYGFAAVLPKPYRLEDLKKILQKVLADTDEQY
ncbi:MAG: ATP-binding protein [Candidatus Scalindua sp.]|nr:ATP-binding protein [Candidatus Scalindua sp.]